MHVSLTPFLEKYIQNKVNCGLYDSASEVIRESLRHMIEEEEQKKRRLQDLNNEIERGMQQLENGEKISAQEVFETLSLKSYN